MPVKLNIVIDDKPFEVESGKTILQVCEDNGIEIPVLCHFKGLVDIGACRLCLVEIEGVNRLLPACTTKVAPNQKIKTQSDRIKKYRRMTIELLFAERNHVCAVCVANNHCDLQKVAYQVGMDHVRFPYLFQKCTTDTSHPEFVNDSNRCILCTRCVRVCHDVEGAHNWDVKSRGYKARIIADYNEPWGESKTCTACGKCIETCPVGALWKKDVAQGQLVKTPNKVSELVEKKRRKRS